MRGPPRPRQTDLAAARSRALAAQMGTMSPAFVAQDVFALADEVERLHVELVQLHAAATVGLPYAKGDAADVLRAVLRHAKGGSHG